MAKTLDQIIKDSLELNYRKSIPWLAAQYNTSITFEKVSALDADGNPKYLIQRMKRLVSQETIANPTDASSTGSESNGKLFAGNALISRMNQLQTIDFESVEVVPFKERIIGVSVAPNAEYKKGGDASQYMKPINGKMELTMEEKNILLINILVASAEANGNVISGITLDGSETNDRNFYLQLQKAQQDIQLHTDEFKSFADTNDLLTLAHPYGVSSLARYKAEVLQGCPELFDTGIVSDFHVDSITGFKEPVLNTVTAANGETVIAIMYDIQGLFDNKTESNEFDDKLLAQRYIGMRYFEMAKCYDPSRVRIITGNFGTTPRIAPDEVPSVLEIDRPKHIQETIDEVIEIEKVAEEEMKAEHSKNKKNKNKKHK